MSTDQNQQIAVASGDPFIKASTLLSHQLGLEPQAMVDAIKTQFFKGKEATNAQLAIVVSIAKELKLNPLLPGQMYPYPGRDGSVVIMLGPDGIYTLLANNADIVAQKDGGPAYWVEHGKDADGKATCTAFINHRTKGLLKKTIWIEEWVVSSNPNWASRKMHMSELRALKQAARLVIHGIPDDRDERQLGEMLNVTESTPEAPARPAPPKRAPKGAAAVRETVQEVEHVTPAETPHPDLEAQTTTPAPEAAAVTPEPVATPVQSFAQAAEATATPAVRTSLNPNEKLTVDITVTELGVIKDAVMAGSKTDMAQATVTGEYNGNVFHPGGASGSPLAPNKPWAIGAKLRLSLVGFQAAKSVKAVVESVQEVEDFG